MLAPQEERNWGTWTYLIPVILNTVTGFGWLAALVMYFHYKDKSPFVSAHAAQSLGLHALSFIMGIIGLFAFFTIVGIPVAIILWILACLVGWVLPIVGAVKAGSGETWTAPIVGDSVKSLMP